MRSGIPIDRQGANLFFQLVSRRYERGVIILTSNQSLGAWGEVFGEPGIASAILDQLLHHSSTINIKGESDRLREKLKAGLVQAKTAAESGPEGKSASSKALGQTIAGRSDLGVAPQQTIDHWEGGISDDRTGGNFT